jgi:twinkle protein
MISRGLKRLAGAAKRSTRPLNRLCLGIVAGPRLLRKFENPPQVDAFESQIGVTKSYAHVSNEKIEEFLQRHNVKYKMRSNGQFVIRECPFCSKPHKNVISNMWTLNIKENSGAFLCFRCGNHGSWYDFVRFILGDTINFEKTSSVGESRDPAVDLRLKTERTAKVVEECEAMYQQLLNVVEQLNSLEKNIESQLSDPTLITHLSILQYLIGTESTDQRHLSLETIKAYKLGIGEEIFKNEEGQSVRIPVVNYPLFRPTVRKGKAEKDLNLVDNLEFDCVRAKLRGVGKENKHYQRFKPVGGHVGVFGLNTFTAESKVAAAHQVVVITEGEYDAMAVFEVTGIPAISLPNGASSLPAQLIAYIERAERVYLWMDNDEAGQMNIESFANKLGVKRTYVIQSDPDSKRSLPESRTPTMRFEKIPRLSRNTSNKPLPCSQRTW